MPGQVPGIAGESWGLGFSDEFGRRWKLKWRNLFYYTRIGDGWSAVAANRLTEDKMEDMCLVTTATSSKSTEGLTCMNMCEVCHGRPCDPHSSPRTFCFGTVHLLDIGRTFLVFLRPVSVSARLRKNTVPITHYEQACCFSISIA